MSSPPQSPPPQAEFPEDIAQDANAQFEQQSNDQATHIGTNATHVAQENENVWNPQEIFEEISEITMISYDAIRAALDHHPQYTPQAQEEPVILEGAIFPIDLPGIQYPIEPPANNLMLHPAGPTHAHAHVYPFGGQTLVAPTTSATYDDDQIPSGDRSWLRQPETHPWIINHQAYLCTFASCNTIVQERNRHIHDSIIHGVYPY